MIKVRWDIDYLKDKSFFFISFFSAPSCLGLPDFQVAEELIAQQDTARLARSR